LNDERRADFDLKRAQKEVLTKRAVERVRQLSTECGTRETARRLGLCKDTVTRYRRMSGLTPPTPLRHLGGGHWVPDDGDE
jgi:hypothetical protein